MSYVNCESTTEMARICLFEEKLSLFKEVAIFSISLNIEVAVFLYNQFQNSFFVIVKYLIFPVFLVESQRYE